MEFESWTNFSIIKSTKETIVVKPNLLTCMLSSVHTPLEQKESGQSRANCCGWATIVLNASCRSEGSTWWLVGRKRLKDFGELK